jgi:hypothetical protein
MIQFTTSTTDILLVCDSTQSTTTTPIEFDGVTVECVNDNRTGQHEYLWNYVTFPAPLVFSRKTFIVSSIEERERCSELFKAKGYKVWRVNTLGNGFSI